MDGLTPRGLRAINFRFDGLDWLVLSFEPQELELLGGVTPAETDVVRGVLAGESNAAIAARRGTSVRTVANQLAALFKKLGVGSRAELVHHVVVGGTPCPRR